MKRYNIYNKVLGLVLAVLTFTACSDTWDDHYSSKNEGMNDNSLWQAISQNSNLSNFAKVVQATGYDKALNSSQVFTVFAPTNDQFSAQEADELIRVYQAEKGKVIDDDNTAVKEFIQNHIAMYNHSISDVSNDSLVMMNGKKMYYSTSTFSNRNILTTNQHYKNGILFTIDGRARFFPNVFEYLLKDADLDSVGNFFHNARFNRNEFVPGRSVAGGIEDGKTVYLDSVFVRQNDLLDYLYADLNVEDSVYWIVAPTNEVWKKLIDEYIPYFNYDNQVRDRDSLAYTNARLAIVNGTTFSRTLNTDAHLRDSALSTSAVERYVNRKYYWGDNNLHYYQYGGISKTNTQKPYAPTGIFSGTDPVACSNGQVLKVSNWNINKLNTFYQWIIVDAEDQGSIRDVSKMENTTTHDIVGTITPVLREVLNNNSFYGKVWNNAYTEFEPVRTTVNHTVIFNIPDVLSNIGYDIYLVTAPALANDSNATAIQRLPMKLKCSIGYHDQEGNTLEEELQSAITTTPDEVNYLLLAENYQFPCSSYGLSGTDSQVTLTVQTNVTSSEQRNRSYTRTMSIDCIMFVPHGISRLNNGRFEVAPHGDGDSYFWLTK